MDKHKEKYLKSLDALEALLESHNDFYGETIKIYEAFKKEIDSDMTYPLIQQLLKDLTALKYVNEIAQHHAPPKYHLIKKHPVGHYQEALNKESEENEEKDKQNALIDVQLKSIGKQIEFHTESISELKNGWKERLIFLCAGASITFVFGIIQYNITKPTQDKPQDIHIVDPKVLIIHDTVYVKTENTKASIPKNK